jgi:hypothetical protein
MATKDQVQVEPYGNRIKGLPGNIDPTKPPKNFRDAMSREDSQEWAEAYDAEHQGFHEHKHYRSRDRNLVPRSQQRVQSTKL